MVPSLIEFFTNDLDQKDIIKIIKKLQLFLLI